MENKELIKQIQGLISQCIGDRTLDEASNDTGLSRNMLYRLMNGDFLRLPKNTVITKLTDPKSNPQNGVQFSDFEKIAGSRYFIIRSSDKDDRKYSTETIVKAIDGIIIDWLLKQEKNACISKPTHSFDFFACVNEIEYIFDYRIIKTDSSAGLIDIKNNAVLNMANNSFGKNTKLIIVTNSKKLFAIFQKTPINIASKVMTMLVNIENGTVIETAELN